MKNTKWIFAAVLVATLAGSFAIAEAKDPGETKSKRRDSDKTAVDPTSAVDSQVRRYAVNYKLSEADQAKLKVVLLAQQKDIADYQKSYAPKIQAVDEQIQKLRDQVAALQKSIAELDKSKDVYRDVRKELELDHQAELNSAITPEQKAARLAVYFKEYTENMHLKFLPKELQASLDQKCQAAAKALVASGEDESRAALKIVVAKLRAELNAAVTPEIRKAAEKQSLQSYAMRAFARIELTDVQKAAIGELCDKSIKDKALAATRYAQIRKDFDAARQAMGRGKSDSYGTIRKDITDNILTEEQKKRLPSKRKTTTKKTKKDKSSRKKGEKRATE
jgi:hypothetical protein